ASPPASGWVTLTTVAGNHYHSRQHVVNLTGYNWVRINVTAVDGSVGNTDVVLNLDLHDASGGIEDDWIFYGDSITQGAMNQETLNGVREFGQSINMLLPTHSPLAEGGGIGGLLAQDGASHIATMLPLFPGKYVG